MNFKRFLLVGGMVTVIVVIAVTGYMSLFPNEGEVPSKSMASPSQLIQTVKTSDSALMQSRAPKTVFDTTGVKSTFQQALHDNASIIAQDNGLSESSVEATVTALDVPSWTAIDLPGTASEYGTYVIDCNGTEAHLITYSDKSYVTVSMLGQNTTLSVPQSAQQYMTYLGYV